MPEVPPKKYWTQPCGARLEKAQLYWDTWNKKLNPVYIFTKKVDLEFEKTLIDHDLVATDVPIAALPKLKFSMLQLSEDSTYTEKEQKTKNQTVCSFLTKT